MRHRENTHWGINKRCHIRKHNNVRGLKIQTRKQVLSSCIAKQDKYKSSVSHKL